MSKNHKKQFHKGTVIAAVCGACALVVIGIILAFLLPGKDAGQLDQRLTYYADITIQDYGTITVQLDQKTAPITTANFVSLAQSGFYDGLTFHRIIEGFMMQGGAPKAGQSPKTIKGEFSENGHKNDIAHKRGVISMARAKDFNSASSQFFIVHQDSPHLDGSYAAFGYVIEGIEIVDAVCQNAKPSDGNGSIPKASQPVITSIKIRTA